MKRLFAPVASPIAATTILFLSVAWGFEEHPISVVQETEQSDVQEVEESEGARLFQSACTLCHDVSGITENPGVYTEAAFRDLVAAMVDYGAPLDPTEAEALVQYLTATYGKKNP